MFDKFECTTTIHDVENQLLHQNVANLNILRRPGIESEYRSTYGHGYSSSTMHKPEEWNVSVGLDIRYHHRIIHTDGVILGQQSLCMTATVSYCIEGDLSGICSANISQCFQRDWNDVSIDEETGIPSFEDRLLTTLNGDFNDVEELPEINYKISCKFKGTEEHQ